MIPSNWMALEQRLGQSSKQRSRHFDTLTKTQHWRGWPISFKMFQCIFSRKNVPLRNGRVVKAEILYIHIYTYGELGRNYFLYKYISIDLIVYFFQYTYLVRQYGLCARRETWYFIIICGADTLKPHLAFPQLADLNQKQICFMPDWLNQSQLQCSLLAKDTN